MKRKYKAFGLVTFLLLFLSSFLLIDAKETRETGSTRTRRQRDELFPSHLSGKCVISELSGRDICYPDISVLDYSCVKKNGNKNSSIPPPMIQNGQYKALITKFRSGERGANISSTASSKPFLVVQFQCNSGHVFLDEAQFLFCRDYHWIQTLPVCVPSSKLSTVRKEGLLSTAEKTNPCQRDHGGCSHTCNVLSSGSSECECPDGMTLDPTDRLTCLDDNPCLIANGGCSHTCQPPDQPGAPAECTCPDDYTLGSDMKTCFQASEWVVKPLDCPQVPYGHPTCDSQCVHDDDCENEKKCCSNGCTYVCLSPDLAAKSQPDVTISPPGHLEVRVGGQVNLTCTGTGLPIPSLTWYQNDKRMAQKEGGLGRADQSLTASKTIFIKELFQSSVFRCEALNDYGVKAAETNVTVLGPGSMPTSIRHRVRATNVTVTWKEPAITNGKIIGYKLYYTTGSARKPLTSWQSMEVLTGRAVLTNLEPLTRYYFRLQAINDRAPGVTSLVFHIKTHERELPPSVVIDGFDGPFGRVELQPLESITLTCNATAGHPPPAVAWYREGGVPVRESTRASRTADLVLTHIMETARFECVATNKHGRANATVDVVITGPGTPPQQIQYRVVDGTNIDLSWGAPKIPNGPIIGYVVFYTSGNPNASLDEWEVQVVEKAQSTILRNLKPKSKYHVRIQAFNEMGHGPASAPVAVDIGAPWTLPKIIIEPRLTAPVPPGFKANITCNATGVPLPSVMWKKGGDEIVSFPEFAANESVTKTLVIERIFETTAFTCEATNSAGTMVSDLEVTVRGPGSAPESVQATADRQTIAVTWEETEYPNGEIKGYYLYFIESTNDTQPLTAWSNVTVDDGQRYDWKLKNLKYHTRYTVRMSAFTLDREGNRQEGPISERAYATTSRDGEPPTIALKPSAPLIQILPGGRVNVTCTGLGTPEPQVKWYKNGKLLGADINPDVPADVIVSSVNLVIKQMYETSSFECRATNPLGSATAGVRVDVQGPGSAPRDVYPIIYSNTIDIQWHEPVLMNGNITGYEIAYTLDPGSDVKNWSTSFIPGANYHHKLNNLSPKTNYTYMVRAFNQHGPGPWSDPQPVITGESESKPRISVLPTEEVYKVRVGGTVNLTCVSEGFPAATVTWHMANVVNDPRFVPESQEVTLNIDNVREPFSVDCVAMNPLGEDRKTIKVDVTGLGGAPMNLQGGAKGTTAHLRWDAPELIEADIKYFLLYYTRQPEISDEKWHIASVPLRLPDEMPHYYWEIPDLKPFAEYTFKVRAYTEEGPGPFSNTIALNTTEKWFLHMELHPDKTADVPVGGGVDVLCKAKGLPRPLVSWWINGKSIAEPQPYVSVLRVDPLNDVTVVNCLAQSDLDTMESSVQLVPSDHWQTTSIPTTWPDEEDGGIVLDWTDLLVGAEEGTMYTIYYTEDATAPLEEWSQVRTKFPLNMRLPNLTEDRQYHLRVRVFPPQREWSIVTAPTQVVTPKFPSNVSMFLENNSVIVKWDDVKIPYMDIAGFTIYYTDDESVPLKDWHSEEVAGPVNKATLPNIHPDKKYYVKLFIETDTKERLPTAVFKTRSPKFDRCEWANCEHACTIFEEEFEAECSCKPGFKVNDDKRTCSPIPTALPAAPTVPSPEDVCLEEMDEGSCRDNPAQVWYYNSTLGECRQFLYGGCGGNENRFSERNECLERCSTKPCLEKRRQTLHLPEEQRQLCDEQGDFEPLQVDGQKGETFCVNPISGDEVRGTRMSVGGTGGKQHCRSCEFKRQHHLSTKQSFAPMCTPEGLYEAKQCDANSDQCWCVDQLNGLKTADAETSEGGKSCEKKAGSKLKQWTVHSPDGNRYHGTWQPADDANAKEYLVYFTDDTNKSMNQWHVLLINDSTQPANLTVTNFLSPNATTTWVIQPKFDSSVGEPSDQYAAKTSAPPQPVDFNVEVTNPKLVQLKWTRDDDLDPSNLTYTFYITDKSTGQQRVLNSSSSWNQTDLPVQSGHDYEVYMTATDENGIEGPPSSKITFKSADGPITSTASIPTDDGLETSGDSEPVLVTASGNGTLTLESSGEAPAGENAKAKQRHVTADSNNGLTTDQAYTAITVAAASGSGTDVGTGGRLFGLRPRKGTTVTPQRGTVKSGLSTAPTTSCTKINFPLDFVIILDASNSNGAVDYPMIKQTLRDMLDKYFQVDPDTVKVGFIQYSAVMAVEFALGQYKDKGDMMNHILKLPHMQGSSRTEEALVAALDIIQPGEGARPFDVPKVVLLVTDGLWIGDASLAAWQLHEAAVYVIAAGVGSNITKEELLSIVSGDETRVLRYPTWKGSKQLLAKDVVTKVCEFMEQLATEETTITDESSVTTATSPKPVKTKPPKSNVSPPPFASNLRLENITAESVAIRWDKNDQWQKAGGTIEIALTDEATGEVKRFKATSAKDHFVVPVEPNKSYKLQLTADSQSLGTSQATRPVKFKSPKSAAKPTPAPETLANSAALRGLRVPVEVSITDVTIGETIAWEIDDGSQDTSDWEFVIYHAEGIYWEGTLPPDASHIVVTDGLVRSHALALDEFQKQNYTFWIQARNKEGKGPLSTAFIVARPGYEFENVTATPSTKSTPRRKLITTTRSTPTPITTVPSAFFSRIAPTIAPVIKEVDQVGPNEAKLSWDMLHMHLLPADWDFVIYYTSDSSQPRDQWHINFAPPNEAGAFILRNLVPEQQYTICVRARNTYGLGPSSNCVDVWLLDLRPPSTGEEENGDEMWTDHNDLEMEKVLATYKQVPSEFNLTLENVTPRTASVHWERDIQWQPEDTVYVFAITDNTTGRGIRLKTPTVNDQMTLAIRPNRTYSVYMISRNTKAKTIQKSNIITFQSPPDPAARPDVPASGEQLPENITQGMNFHPVITEIDQISRTTVRVRWLVENADALPSDLYFVLYYSSNPSLPKDQWRKVIAAPSDTQRGKIIDRLQIGQHYDVCVNVRNATSVGPTSPCVPFFLPDVPAPTKQPKTAIRGTPAPKPRAVTTSSTRHKQQTHKLDSREKEATASSKFNLRIEAVTPHVISVRWNPRKGPSRSTFSLTERETGAVVNFTTSSATDQYLLAVRPNATYQLTAVTVSDDKKDTQISNSISFKTPDSAADAISPVTCVRDSSLPAGPVIQEVEQISDTSIKLHWSYNNSLNFTVSDWHVAIYYSADLSLPKHAWSNVLIRTGWHSSREKAIENLEPERRYVMCIELRHKNQSIISQSSCVPVYLGSFPTPPPFVIQRNGGKNAHDANGRFSGVGSTISPPKRASFTTESAPGATALTPVLLQQAEVNANSETETNDAATVVPSMLTGSGGVTPAYDAYTRRIPVEHEVFVPSCNCTCVIDNERNQRRCYFDNETVVTVVEAPDGQVVIKVGEKEVQIKRNDCDDEQKQTQRSGEVEDDGSFLLTTPVPQEFERDCPCVKPLRGDQCPPGYRLWNGRCRDIDECEYKNGGCSHGCVNTHGGFYCACPPGLLADPNDQFKCVSQDDLLKRMSKLMYIHMWHNGPRQPGVKVTPMENYEKALEEHKKAKGGKGRVDNSGKGQTKAILSNGTNTFSLEWQWSELFRKLRL